MRMICNQYITTNQHIISYLNFVYSPNMTSKIKANIISNGNRRGIFISFIFIPTFYTQPSMSIKTIIAYIFMAQYIERTLHKNLPMIVRKIFKTFTCYITKKCRNENRQLIRINIERQTAY